MGKRSSFERRERDFYPSPLEAVLPLLPHLAPGTRFIEPCAGNGALVLHLEQAGMVCRGAYDIENHERLDGFNWLVGNQDATTYQYPGASLGSIFITNPAWDRRTLHPLIENLSRQAPTWLLFDADWLHTRQSAPYLRLLHKVVSVGRVKWIPDSKMTGKDNCAWYLFDATPAENTLFFGRTERAAA